MPPGVALSQSVLGKNGIVTVFFGDGAACEGIFHEALNLASVWNLPILFVCENNQWQAFVHRRETMGVDHISDWASRYGIYSMTVDGKITTRNYSPVDFTTREDKMHLFQFDPAHTPDGRAVATVYQGLGQNDAAAEQLRYALELQPSNDDAHRILSRVLVAPP